MKNKDKVKSTKYIEIWRIKSSISLPLFFSLGKIIIQYLGSIIESYHKKQIHGDAGKMSTDLWQIVGMLH